MGKKKKYDKYGVNTDPHAYIDNAKVASVTDYTGIVPVSMESEEEKESYTEMFNVPVGQVDKKYENKDSPKRQNAEKNG